VSPTRRRGAGALGEGPRGLDQEEDQDGTAPERNLTVAVTGPTGTFGAGLIPLLQDDDRVAKIIGIARRPFDPAERGWTKMEYRQGDVRDPEALQTAFRDVDVVVHLAFMITGNASRQTTREINVDGTLNVFRAAAAAGARRFVYASSLAAYGFHADNPELISEDWPVRPAARLFYAQEKAELEHLLESEAASGGPDLYLLRPPIVLGPNAVGAKDVLPGVLAPLGRFFSRPRRLPVPIPLVVPEHPLQFVHEEDVGRARCSCAWSPPGRPAPTTSPARACSPPPTWPASSARYRCGCPPRPHRRPPGRCPASRSCPRRPNGSRPRAGRPSWTPRRPVSSSAGSRATPGWRLCATRCGTAPSPERPRLMGRRMNSGEVLTSEPRAAHPGG
jgi:nucleoside-diphosphate-sugar epimerase